MGVEAFVIPWLALMLSVATVGALSLGRRLWQVLGRTAAGKEQSSRRYFWLKQAIKIVIVLLALSQAIGILERGL
ncbi:MAG: hypothetical protein CMN72_14145 [Sphingomonas sp.]|uniref:Uncharacterized protein n=1 Tax=Stakelama pacifica TaxID=517720 RepID=A0A4R6FGX6_9SPHN|nr:hypothetical protein [Sphingomonas sp.]TDN80621.1 hypothetical protein EV664_1099 [Stakelama pacifica]GGO97622.1 hypothetical protein GCM10011329_26930 [Stakelama pacifica]|tara:strand:- start:23 stop:247 length:225 start_codon:yes stop_codon:yes gene_type:complete